MKRAFDDPQSFLTRLSPVYTSLFRAAHAVVGNLELSEYVLRNAIVEAYLRREEWRERMSFEDGLLHTVREVALVELRGMRQAGAFEEDWAFPMPPAPQDAAGRALLNRLIKEGPECERVALMFYGCAMTPKQIAFALNIRAQDAAGRLRRLRSRLSRAVRGGGKNALEDRMEALMLSALSVPGPDVAEMGAVFRSFERDVDGAKKPRASGLRVAGGAIKIALAVALAALFWLRAVLIEPSESKNTAPVAAQEQRQTQS